MNVGGRLVIGIRALSWTHGQGAHLYFYRQRRRNAASVTLQESGDAPCLSVGRSTSSADAFRHSLLSNNGDLGGLSSMIVNRRRFDHF